MLCHLRMFAIWAEQPTSSSGKRHAFTRNYQTDQAPSQQNVTSQHLVERLWLLVYTSPSIPKQPMVQQSGVSRKTKTGWSRLTAGNGPRSIVPEWMGCQKQTPGPRTVGDGKHAVMFRLSLAGAGFVSLREQQAAHHSSPSPTCVVVITGR